MSQPWILPSVWINHFPYGPDCRFEDINVFNYNKYLEAKKELEFNLDLEHDWKAKSKKNVKSLKDNTKPKDDGKVYDALSAMSAESPKF